MESPGFSRFRELIDRCDEATKELDMRARLTHLLNSSDFSMFFKKGDSVYGAPEESRVVMARIKNPDQDTPEGWADHATFSAVNLDKMGEGEGTHSTFGSKDLPEIKILDQEKVVDELVGKKKK